MGDFSKLSNFNPNANFKMVRIGADSPVLEVELNEMQKETPTEELAYIINSVDGGEVPKDAKKIIHLYTKGDIDLETAKFAIGRIVARW